MSREKIITAQSTGQEDEQFNIALRPRTLGECIGGGDLLEKLRISIAAARGR
ncbi:MAG TPA: Holliday junction branch migration DNA helicase RuvB, partial [Phycisphaerales bacterium]|nr:Holliday junction branch migration DNA helicase RuvB [Phycisphaerales bacterium]